MSTEVLEKNNKKVINAWCMYDWANSVYSLVITSTIFPIYFNSSTKSAFRGEEINFLGMTIKNSILYSYSISFSFLILCLINPILSGIADAYGNKKSFMKFFAWMGSAACIGLYFFVGSNPVYGIFCAVLASIGFAGSLVFYNAFLPEIATNDRFDAISAKGFSLGYLGSFILQVFCLTLIMFPQWYFDVDSVYNNLIKSGIKPAEALIEAKDSFGGIGSRISFLLTGCWWAGFSIIPFVFLPKNLVVNKSKLNLMSGFTELKKVYHKVKQIPLIKNYLFAYFFFNMGVQTVMYLAVQYGSVELKLESSILITAILIIQIVAIVGAQLFAFISKKTNNLFSLSIMLLIWMAICVLAFFTKTQNEFLGLAFLVGAVMGGIQSLSRATFSKIIPEGDSDHASFFSFYDLMEKFGLILGPLVFGLTHQLTGSMKYSVWPLFIFFVIGYLIIRRLKTYDVKGLLK